MGDNKITVSVEQQFGEVIDIILRHKSRASKAVNGHSGLKLKDIVEGAFTIWSCFMKRILQRLF